MGKYISSPSLSKPIYKKNALRGCRTLKCLWMPLPGKARRRHAALRLQREQRRLHIHAVQELAVHSHEDMREVAEPAYRLGIERSRALVKPSLVSGHAREAPCTMPVRHKGIRRTVCLASNSGIHHLAGCFKFGGASRGLGRNKVVQGGQHLLCTRILSPVVVPSRSSGQSQYR